MTNPSVARRLLRLLLLITLLLAAHPARAADNASGAVLSIANRDIATLRANLPGQSPDERVARIRDRVQQIPTAQLPQPVELHPLSYQGQNGIALTQHGLILMALFQDDLAPDDAPLSISAENARQKLQQALQAQYEQDNPHRLITGILLALLATAGMALTLWLLQRARRGLDTRLTASTAKTTPARSTWRLVLIHIERGLLSLLHLTIGLFLADSWLTFSLLQFPYTQPWGEQLGQSLWDLLARFGNGILGAIPGLCTTAAIFLLTRMTQRGLNLLFTTLEQQHVRLPGLYPETVGATRRLMGVVLWLFALSLAYPYLPGSNSDAFKGVSVFFGLMISLGSAGVVNQAMSGLVLVYSRALKAGDWVQLGDVEGTVAELGPLSTKIVNRLEQEITLPNAVITNAKIVNYSRLARECGMLISTSVTIGYDTPWRQVEAMLELAARRTALLDLTLAPRVRQLALQDFYIHYELCVHLAPGANKPDALNALHGEIQDVFNQFGVQIMSPNFVMQPEKNVVVAEEDWYAAPAKTE